MAQRSGWLLVPILLMSIAVVAVTVERALGLRRSHVLPRPLVRQVREQIRAGEVDPAQTQETCAGNPSVAADVVTAMLAKVGRPHTEVESAAAEEIDRQADRLYANVRTLNLAAAVAPLMGLFGTVWGMIEAFFVTASSIEGNKGQELADGIYVALFTTFAGLAVAIPAAVLAHFFEGRILSLMRKIEKLTGDLLPCLEKYEGRRSLAAMRSSTAGSEEFGARTDPAWTGTPRAHPTTSVRPPAPPRA